MSNTQQSVASFDWKWFYFSFQGRIPRSDYWLKYFIPALIINLALNWLVPVIGFVVALVLAWVGLATGAKRLHDRGKSGWFQLILIIPIVGLIWWLIDMGCLRGTNGSNRYGADPLVGK